MSTTHTIHTNHDHTHGPGCGHPTIEHEGHVDYVHDGHLHHVHGGHVDDHTLAVSGKNPGGCTPAHACNGHAKDHVHGPTCGHVAVSHGGHTDYVVGGHLHSAHADHCDDHGSVVVS